ncbi:hypothetical protein PR202_ga25064 [Eleusine coracana subsp. coracana]|uniref:Uncharacterized protein n=1 Tax=Eleusine coracana subsp. coracana TaxID=191504 RepID=A0AAV5DA28_ELECO|nr:hypothetical protein PR202_ga25064 [Eleusine coracana subsp. coracana]
MERMPHARAFAQRLQGKSPRLLSFSNCGVPRGAGGTGSAAATGVDDRFTETALQQWRWIPATAQGPKSRYRHAELAFTGHNRTNSACDSLPSYLEFLFLSLAKQSEGIRIRAESGNGAHDRVTHRSVEILLRCPCSPCDPSLEQASGPAATSPTAREHPYRRACSTFARAVCSASASAAARARGGGQASVEEQRRLGQARGGGERRHLGELEAAESGGVWASSRRRPSERGGVAAAGRARGGGQASVEERQRLSELEAMAERAWRSGGCWGSSRRWIWVSDFEPSVGDQYF